jgi:peroxiredoxin
LQKIAGDIANAGGTLVAICPQMPARSRALEKKLGLDFEMLHDSGNAVAESYGLRFELPDDLRAVYANFGVDLPKNHGNGGWELPMPARYVIGVDGKVSYAVVHPDYTQRPEPQETLEALLKAKSLPS